MNKTHLETILSFRRKETNLPFMFKYSQIAFKKPTLLANLPYRHLFRQSSLRMSTDTRLIKPHNLISFEQEISVKLMTKSDLEIALQWAEKEGWHPGLYELEALYAADPTGYYMLHVDEQPVASLACVRHSPQFAFLGLFIVLPAFRNQGYGKILWDIVLGKAMKHDSLGLNAVMNQINRYKKSGFLEHYLISRWRINLDKIPGNQGITQDNLILCDTVPTDNILSYDAKFFTYSRKNFLTKWLEIPESRTLTALNNDGDILGYGTVSRTSEGYKIAPLIANNQGVADLLYKELCLLVGKEKPAFIDMPEVNPATARLVQQFKMEKIFDTMRMYSGNPPQENGQKTIGTTSLEIGY